ncbi:hypothetical protein L286_23175 [Sphingobium sp. HDIP04]|nr:hypothetical protein L286_23175 [Sphingobium sp. HDIP04]
MEIAFFIGPQKTMGMTCRIADTDHHPGMLNAAIWIQEPRSYSADIIPQGLGSHCFQPCGLDDLDVIVEQAQEASARLPDGAIVDCGIVECAFVAQHSITCGVKGIEKGKCLRIIAVIVDDDHLEIGIVGRRESVQTCLQQIHSVTSRHNDSHGGKFLPHCTRNSGNLGAGAHPAMMQNLSDMEGLSFRHFTHHELSRPICGGGESLEFRVRGT